MFVAVFQVALQENLKTLKLNEPSEAELSTSLHSVYSLKICGESATSVKVRNFSRWFSVFSALGNVVFYCRRRFSVRANSTSLPRSPRG